MTNLTTQDIIDLINQAPIVGSNSSGGDYAAGTLVYVSSLDTDGVPILTKADADAGDNTYATYVLNAPIGNGATGYVWRKQDVTKLDTSAAGAVGDPVYLSATAGAFTFTRPTGVAIVQRVGTVVVKSATVGTITFGLSANGGGGPIPEQVRAQTVAGAAANTNIAITGITTNDRIVTVSRFVPGTPALSDDTANCSITSAGNIQSTTNTTGNQLIVIWAKRS